MLTDSAQVGLTPSRLAQQRSSLLNLKIGTTSVPLLSPATFISAKPSVSAVFERPMALPVTVALAHPTMSTPVEA